MTYDPTFGTLWGGIQTYTGKINRLSFKKHTFVYDTYILIYIYTSIKLTLPSQPCFSLYLYLYIYIYIYPANVLGYSVVRIDPATGKCSAVQLDSQKGIVTSWTFDYTNSVLWYHAATNAGGKLLYYNVKSSKQVE